MTSSIQVSELLPCPFCGHEAGMRTTEASQAAGFGLCYKARCTYCECEPGPWHTVEAEAIETWNTRAMKAAEPLAQGDEKPVIDFEQELARLYNHKDDDSAQFTRWNMLVAIRHGMNLAMKAAEPLAQGDESRMREALIFTRNLIITEEVEWKLGEAIDRINAALVRSPQGDENSIRLALEDADYLERIADEADDNNWQDWAATMRGAAAHIRAALVRSKLPIRLEQDKIAEIIAHSMGRFPTDDPVLDATMAVIAYVNGPSLAAITAIGSQSDEADDPHWEQKAIAKLGSQSIEGERG